MIKINGECIETKELPLLTYLLEHGYNSKRIAVECNEEIIPKSSYDTCILRDGDVIEIVGLVGGG